ncbi:MAG: MerR family transcriptional regulator [Alphaproteobacteria bacterium]|nr:MerR family transcriptional regulator [Alphaproteobacteria bacterium]
MGFRIKTVSMLTGVSENTLRAWERRYGFVVPKRNDNGYREYDDDDLAVLQAVKQFVDDGYNVREAIELVDEARKSPVDRIEGRKLRIAVLHEQLVAQIGLVAAHEPPLHIAWQGASLDELPDHAPPGGVDVAVADLDRLGAAIGAALDRLRRRLGARQVLVVYQFATHEVIAEVIRAGGRLLRGPIRVDALHQAVVELVALHSLQQGEREEPPAASPAARRATPATPPLLVPPGQAPPRLLDDAQLARLRELHSSIDCECPNHMASLVSSLVAFETYSRACEIRFPDEAELHASLAEGTGRARHLMEQLVLQLARVEGLDL